VNIYKSTQVLKAQPLGEPVLTEEARSPEQHNVEPEKKMATHHRLRDSSKQNLLKVHEQVRVFIPSLTLLNHSLLFCISITILASAVCEFN
jgi:hypothetical protein